MFNGNNLPHELLLTSRQTTKLRSTIENNISTDIKLFEAQISKIIQSGGYLGKLLGPLLKIGLPLIKNVIKPLARSDYHYQLMGLPLGLTAAAAAADAGIPKRILGSGTTTLIISNEEMNDIMKIVQALENSNILLKEVTKTIKNEKQIQRGGFLSMLLDTLGAYLLENLLTGKGTVRAGEGIVRAGYGPSIKNKALTPPHPLTNFEIKEYYENEPRFNGAYSRDNLPKTIKNGAYAIDLDEYADVDTHWISLYVKNNEVIYFDSSGVEYVPKEIMHFIGHRDIKTNIFRMQADNSILCGYFSILFLDYMLANRGLIDYSSLFSPYNFKKNDKIILDYFK